MFSKQIRLLSFLGLLFTAVVFVHLVMNQWEWSYFMDEISYIQWMPTTPHLWDAFRDEVLGYWAAGRLTLLKAILNVLKFHYLPLSPLVHHLFCFGLLFFTGWISFLSLNSQPAKNRFGFFLVFLALFYSQRPLLDILALLSIPEQYTLCFVALGVFFLFRGNGFIYRLFFIFSTLCKEPAVVLFLSSIGFHFLNSDLDQNQKKKNIAIDLLCFGVLLFFIRMAMSHSVYLQGYEIFSIQNIQKWIFGLVKVFLGTLPVLLLVDVQKLKKIFLYKKVVFFALFTIGYFLLSSSRAPTGYLLIPASWGALMLLLSLPMVQEISKVRVYTFAALVVLFFGMSFYRYHYYVESLTEGTRYLRESLDTKNEILFFTHSLEEVPSSVNMLSKQMGKNIRSYGVEHMSELDPDKVKEFWERYKGLKVYYIDFFGYFGMGNQPREPEVPTLQTQWSIVQDEKTFRVWESTSN